MLIGINALETVQRAAKIAVTGFVYRWKIYARGKHIGTHLCF